MPHHKKKSQTNSTKNSIRIKSAITSCMKYPNLKKTKPICSINKLMKMKKNKIQTHSSNRTNSGRIINCTVTRSVQLSLKMLARGWSTRKRTRSSSLKPSIMLIQALMKHMLANGTSVNSFQHGSRSFQYLIILIPS